jgi:hypothetical protein
MWSTRAQPVVEARLVFPAGDFNSGPSQAGVAGAAAALLEHGAGGITLKDFVIQEWVLRLGARLSAEVDEHTTFTVRGSSTFSDWHVWRLHWLLEHGRYSNGDVERAREAATRQAAGAWPAEEPPMLAQVPAMRPVTGPTWIAHTDPDALPRSRPSPCATRAR